MLAIIGKIRTSRGIFNRLIIKNNKIIILDNSANPPEDCNIFDLGNRVLIPPLTDSHVHFIQSGIYLNSLDLGELKTCKELLAFLREISFDEFIIDETLWGYNFDPIDNMPSAKELDKATNNLPVFIRRIDGHSCSLSSAAITMLPEKLRNKTGIYIGSLQEKIVKFFLRSLNESALIKAVHKVSENALNAGAFYIHALFPLYEWIEVTSKIQDKLPIKTTNFFETTDIKSVRSLGLKHIGGCLLLDGSFGSHTAALREPYTDDPDNLGILYWSDKKLESFFSNSLNAGLSVAMHAIGDRAVEQYLRIAEKISNREKLEGWRIEHAELVDKNLLRLVAKMGITLSVQPAFETRWGGPDKLYAKRLGNRWRKTNPFRDEIDAGISLLGGSDSYITPIDPVGGIFACIKRMNPEQSIKLEEAIALFADNPAKWENRETPLMVGSKAQTVILDKDFDFESKPKVIGIVKNEEITLF